MCKEQISRSGIPHIDSLENSYLETAFVHNIMDIGNPAYIICVSNIPCVCGYWAESGSGLGPGYLVILDWDLEILQLDVHMGPHGKS